MSVLILTASALAAPIVAADPYRVSPGTVDALVTPDLTGPEGFVGGVDLGWSRGLMAWTGADDAQVWLLEDAVGLTVSAWRGWSRGGVGLSAPAYVHLGGDLSEPGSGLGDLRAEGRLALWQAPSAGISAFGMLSVPMGGADLLISDGALGGGGGLIGAVGGEGGQVRLAAGYRTTPEVTLGEATLDDRVTGRLAVVSPPLGVWRATAELLGEVSYRELSGEGVPLEVLLSGHRHRQDGRLLRVGVGAGLLPGIGAPAWRLTVGVGQVGSETTL